MTNESRKTNFSKMVRDASPLYRPVQEVNRRESSSFSLHVANFEQGLGQLRNDSNDEKIKPNPARMALLLSSANRNFKLKALK